MNNEKILIENIFDYRNISQKEVLAYLKRANINPDELIEKSLKFLNRKKDDKTNYIKDSSPQHNVADK